jgi:DNA repair protein RadC
MTQPTVHYLVVSPEQRNSSEFLATRSHVHIGRSSRSGYVNSAMMEMAFLDHEQMRILVLDTKNRVVENISRYQGTVNSSVLRAAEVYRPAVIRNCPAVIICHNHPSGDPTPSPEDIAVTQQLVAAGQHLDIELVDHLVIGNQRFVSLKERLRW